MTRYTYLHSRSAATESLIHPERGIELSQDEDMTSQAYLMSMIGQLTCRSGMLPASSLWVLNAASEQRPTTQMTPGMPSHLLLKDRIIKVGHTGTPASKCVRRDDVFISCMCVYMSVPVSVCVSSDLSPEIHHSDRDYQHQQQIFSPDHVHSGIFARKRYHGTKSLPANTSLQKYLNQHTHK